VSRNYKNKQWTNHERKAAQARAFRENREYILPIRLDDTQIDGILETTGYIDYRNTEVEEIVSLLVEKLQKTDSSVKGKRSIEERHIISRDNHITIANHRT
jgi:hypothetical protein